MSYQEYEDHIKQSQSPTERCQSEIDRCRKAADELGTHGPLGDRLGCLLGELDWLCALKIENAPAFDRSVAEVKRIEPSLTHG